MTIWNASATEIISDGDGFPRLNTAVLVANNGAGSGAGIVFKNKSVSTIGGFGQEFFFFEQSGQRSYIVAHDVGQTDMTRRGNEVGAVHPGSFFGFDDGQHHGLGMTIHKANAESRKPFYVVVFDGNETKLIGGLQREEIVVYEGRLFALVGMAGPFVVQAVGPIDGVGKSRYGLTLFGPFDSAASMIEMEVCEENIGDVFGLEAMFLEGADEGVFSVRLKKVEKFIAFFIAHSSVYEDISVFVLHQQATHGPGAEVVVVGRIEFLPDSFGHNAKHGAAVQFEKAGVQCGDFHKISVLALQRL